MSDSNELNFQPIALTNTPTESQTMSDLIELTVTNGQPTTTSLQIAERFGKQHKHVLRDIENLTSQSAGDGSNFGPVSSKCEGDVPKFGGVPLKSEGVKLKSEFETFVDLNFQGSAYKGGNGELRPMYHITKDGFMFLAMGFTGKEAAAWKVRFIAAFNAMERQLLEHAAAQQIPKPDGTLFLSHRVDIFVAADRSFRASIRSSRQAGLSLPAALRRANQVTIEKTGIDMLSELQAHDHLADLEAQQQPTGHAAAHPNPANQPVAEFWAALLAGEFGAVGHEPMLSQQVYRLYLRWCRLQGNNRPLNLPRMLAALYHARSAKDFRKRYVKADGAVIGPVAFVFPKNCGRDLSQPETVWLGDCVRRVEAALAHLNA